MEVSGFSEARKAFILKQGYDEMPVADICRTAGISHLVVQGGLDR
jgi:putative transposase